MSDSIFPDDPKDAELTYKHLVDRGKELRAPHECQWHHTSLYCRGARNFVLNYKDGTVKASYTDARGRTKFVYEELLAKYAMQKGRLLGLDLTPRVIRRNDSLDGQRNAATVQAVLSHLFPANRVNALKNACIQPFLFYGTLGLSLWEDPQDRQAQDIHLIPPWQITPIPTRVTHPGSVRGLIIRKKMAIEDIKRQYKNMKPRKGAISEAETTTVPRADVSDVANDNGIFIGGIPLDDWFTDAEKSKASKTKTGADNGKTDQVETAWLGCVHLWDERGFMTEQLYFVGTKLLARESYWQMKMYRPITTIHDIDVGGFFSRSWMELQIPINSEQEGAIGQTFQNVKKMDLYGRTLVPLSFGLNSKALVSPDEGGPKYMPYDWDALSPGGQNIVQIRPFTSGNFATQALAVGAQISDRMAKQPPMLSGDAPGRVDSASALGTLLESGNTPIAPSAVALSFGFSDVYKSSVCHAMRTYNVGDTIAVTMLDDSLVGIVYDATKGSISLSDSGIPHPDEVEITVRSMAPVSKQQQKMELENQLAKGIIDPTDYRINARLMNLEIPVGNTIEWENYVKARMENSLLFHDGKTIPDGTEEQVGVLFSQRADMHEIHLRVHRELVASIKFSLASPEIRKRILNHLDLHEAALGKMPDQMPNLEDAAEESLAMMQMQGQQQPMV